MCLIKLPFYNIRHFVVLVFNLKISFNQETELKIRLESYVNILIILLKKTWHRRKF